MLIFVKDVVERTEHRAVGRPRGRAKIWESALTVLKIISGSVVIIIVVLVTTYFIALR
jgi:hypothetical protein